ncbi:MAG TPA: sodium:calcium antiporter [Actinomycetota bacterium]|nr:sodium:calcium antiporter [Actinomycetota bacterium]
MYWFELVASLAMILVSAELFTNGIEWVGSTFGLSEGAVGSVLAAVGTALPETLLPLVALLVGRSHRDVGIGAILGAPFMLTTLAMFVMAMAVLLPSRRGRRSRELQADGRVMRQDLGSFLVMYTLAVAAGLARVAWLRWVLAPVLVVAYALYVRRHFREPAGATNDDEGIPEVIPLHFRRWANRALASRGEPVPHPSAASSVTQALVALAGMVAGARIFVNGVDGVAARFHVPQLALALLLAPLATELPEKFNSVIWVRRRRDTLALGNLTGAMVFQSCFPVSVGLLLTPWRLTGEGLVAALVALGGGAILWLTVRIRGTLNAKLLLLQGGLYAGYVAYVLTRL